MSPRFIPILSLLLLSTTALGADLIFSDGTVDSQFDPLLAPSSLSSLIVTNHSTLNYFNNTPPAGFANTVLGGSAYGNILWNYSTSQSTPLSLSFGQAPIEAVNGNFTLNITAPSNSSSIFASLDNPIIVHNYLALSGNTDTPVASATFNFTGPITLGGQLLLASDRGTNYQTSAAQFTTIIASGPITLDQSTPYELDLGPDGAAQYQTIISGNILDDPEPLHTAQKPLTLFGALEGSSTSTLTIAGPQNTYSTGTTIQFGSVAVAPTSRLGIGNVTVQSGALHLSSFSSIAPGKTILLQYDSLSTLAITCDQDPSSLIDPQSLGVLALDTTFTTPLDESKLGHGQMALGTTANGIYAATTLRPGNDHIYRFNSGYGADYTSALTILHSVLADYVGIPSAAQLAAVTLAASNTYSGGTTITGEVYVTANGALGTGNVSIGTDLDNPWYGRLYLSVPNAYPITANVDVTGSLYAIGPNGSIPLTVAPPVFHPGSALVLGDNLTNFDRYPDSMPISLNSSTLILKGIGTTNETVGPLSISGVSTIVLWNPSSTPTSTTLFSPSLTHNPHAVLFLVPYQPQPYVHDAYLDVSSFLPFGPTGANNNNVILTSPPPVTSGMAPPWIQSRSTFYDAGNSFDPNPVASFLNYTPNGFATPSYVPLPTAGGTGTEIVDVQNNSAIDLPANTSIYALRTSANIPNPASGTATIHILSGAIIATSALIQPNVDFTASEAYINVDADNSNDASFITLEISGVVTANHGLTKFGPGNLLLSNLHDQISGPISILEGTLQLATLPEPTSTDPIRISNGAALSFPSSTILSRPATFAVDSDSVMPGGTISVGSNQSLTITAPITGAGFNSIAGGTLVRIAAPITGTGSLTINAKEINLASTITIPSLDLALDSQGKLTGAGIISTTDFYFDNGMISPGDHPGDLATITFDTSMSLADGASLLIDADPSGHSDRLLVTGNLAITTFDPSSIELPTTLNLNFLTPPTGQIYTLISAADITGTFYTVTGLPTGYSLDYTPTALLLLPTSPIPEPSTLLLLTLTSALLLPSRRHRPSQPQPPNNK